MIRIPRLTGSCKAGCLYNEFWFLRYPYVQTTCGWVQRSILFPLFVLIDGFEEDPYLVHRKLALAGTMLLSSYGMASFLSCKWSRQDRRRRSPKLRSITRWRVAAWIPHLSSHMQEIAKKHLACFSHIVYNTFIWHGVIAQLVRALRWHRRGLWFESK